MEKDDKGSTMIRMGVSGWMFLLVPAYPGCPGQTTVKWLLLLLLLLYCTPTGWPRAHHKTIRQSVLVSVGRLEQKFFSWQWKVVVSCSSFSLSEPVPEMRTIRWMFAAKMNHKLTVCFCIMQYAVSIALQTVPFLWKPCCTSSMYFLVFCIKYFKVNSVLYCI